MEVKMNEGEKIRMECLKEAAKLGADDSSRGMYRDKTADEVVTDAKKFENFIKGKGD